VGYEQECRGVFRRPKWDDPGAVHRDSGARFAAVDLPEANELTVGIMALVAQAEREAISKRTKEALAVARSRGVRLGNTQTARRRCDGLRRAVWRSGRPAPQTQIDTPATWSR
jgi:hypothetical protein